MKRAKRRTMEFCVTEYGTVCKVPKNQWRPCTWRTISKKEALEMLRKGCNDRLKEL